MKIIKKHNLLKSRWRGVKPTMVVIHHTAGGNLSGAESALRNRGLGYHYMIDKDGTVYEYGNPTSYMAHAYKRNLYTIGVSYVGGRTPFDAITDKQYASLEELILHIKANVPSVKYITGHKHIDPRTKDSKWPAKPDPYWQGDTPKGYVDGSNWRNDEAKMAELSRHTGLKVYSELFPNMGKGY